MLSIIIPALNEEDYLPLLLDSIKKQTEVDYEIILADAGSRDATLEIAKEYHCIIAEGGLPARGRNNGAKIAKGEILFFVDADVVLSEHFLEKSLQEFRARNLDIGSFGLKPLPYRKLSSFLVELFYNKPIIFFETSFPHAATGIIIKRSLFEKLEGFDEQIKLSEDHDLARRAQKMYQAKCGIFRSVKIFVSDRRFRKDGWFNIGMKYFLCEMHIIFIGPVKSDIFNYKFDHYKDKNDN